MNLPAPIVQISPAVAQEVIVLQAAELVRLRGELANQRVWRIDIIRVHICTDVRVLHYQSAPRERDPHGVVSLEQFNELRSDLLDAVFSPSVCDPLS